MKILFDRAIHGAVSPDNTRIAYDKQGDDGYYDVVVSEGENTQNITAANPDIPQRHSGWPTWHPSGELLVFQVQAAKHVWDDQAAVLAMGMPGFGMFNNLWAARTDGSDPIQLTDVPIRQTPQDPTPIYATVNPRFSKDGSKLYWTERYANGSTLDWGWWQIKVADYAVDDAGVPRLYNTRVFLRAADFCEGCNYINLMAVFSDGNRFLLAGNLDGQHPYGMDQYIYDARKKKLLNLTNTPELWEEGACLSPDETLVVHQTNRGSPWKLDFTDKTWWTQPRTREWWIVGTDGTGKQRLSYFNEPGSPEYEAISKGQRAITAECKFSPDGRALLGAVGIDQWPSTAKQARFHLQIVRVELAQ